MFRFAIIEDDEKDAIALNNCILDFFDGREEKCETKIFKNATAFVDKYSHDFDALFMDIEMPGTNGVEASKRIRELDQNIPIVFVTGTVQYAVDGYSVDAFDCFIKPVTPSAFFYKFERLLKHISREKNEFVTVRTSSGLTNLPLNTIIYVEVREHYLEYHTERGVVRVNGKLSTIEEKLSNNGFFKCNRCYLVNLRFVRSYDGDIIDVYGERLLVSRRRKAEFMRALAKYYGEK